jgi:ApbE family.
LFDKMNKSLSTYIADSDISKINSGDTSVVVDDYFKEVFLKSKRIHKETEWFF